MDGSESSGGLAPASGRLDGAAPWLLLFGWVLCGVGWVVGVVLLLRSSAWTPREKLLGVLVLTGGLAPAVAFAASIGVGACTSTPTGAGTCGSQVPLAGVVLVLVFLSAAPVTIDLWLGHLRRERLRAPRGEHRSGKPQACH